MTPEFRKKQTELTPEQEAVYREVKSRVIKAERINKATRHLQRLTRSPLTRSEFTNGLEFADRIFDDLVLDPDLQVVVDFTEKPGQGKTETRRAFVEYTNSRCEAEEIELSIAVLEFDTDAEDVVGKMISQEIKRRELMEEEYVYSEEYEELLEAMVDLEPRTENSDPELRETLKAQFDNSNRKHLPERYKSGTTHDDSGKHADYKPDHNAFLRAARSYLAIQISRKLQEGNRLVAIEHSSGLKVRLGQTFSTLSLENISEQSEKGLTEVELRSYPHDIMHHLRKGRGPFNNEICQKAKIGYCSVVGGIITVEIMDKVRAAIQKAQDLDEASAVSEGFRKEAIETTRELIERTKGGSLDVIVLTAIQEKQIIDEYGLALGLNLEHPQLFELATIDHSLDSAYALREIEKKVDKHLQESGAEEENKADKKDETNDDPRLVREIIDRSKELTRYIGEKGNEELLVYYSSLLARKFLVSKLHQMYIENLAADYEIHTVNESPLPTDRSTILQEVILRAMQEHVDEILERTSDLDQPDL